MVQATELPIDVGASDLLMAETIFGDDVVIVSASFNGDDDSSGVYSSGDTISPFATPSDTGVILSTGDAQDFTNSTGSSNQSNSTSTNTSGQSGNIDFNDAANASTFDAAYLDVEFIPTGDMMTMQFVFSSEEYPEFTSSSYQDFVGVWVNGDFIELTVGDGDTDPGNINTTTNQNLYLDNTSDAYNTEMDGLTVTMTLTFPVTANDTNTIRIGIADVGDSSYDSNLLIAANSLQTSLIANDDYTSLTGSQTKTINILPNDENTGSGTLTITHIDGQPVTVGVPVSLPTGQTITVTSDGKITLVGDGTDEDFNFTYTVSDGTAPGAITDTAVVHVSSVPCFTSGTRIRTQNGNVPIEMLQVGDLVETCDDGLQPIRWIGSRTVPAEGDFAPIYIAANVFGEHDALRLSPLHRVLIRDSLAEILFDNSEVLVAARDLVNDHSIVRQAGGMVQYFHLLFDSHQIIFAEGLATESFFLGPQTTKSLDQEVVAEICSLFPEINPETGHGYSPSVRRSLRRFEADVLVNSGRAA